MLRSPACAAHKRHVLHTVGTSLISIGIYLLCTKSPNGWLIHNWMIVTRTLPLIPNQYDSPHLSSLSPYPSSSLACNALHCCHWCLPLLTSIPFMRQLVATSKDSCHCYPSSANPHWLMPSSHVVCCFRFRFHPIPPYWPSLHLPVFPFIQRRTHCNNSNSVRTLPTTTAPGGIYSSEMSHGINVPKDQGIALGSDSSFPSIIAAFAVTTGQTVTWSKCKEGTLFLDFCLSEGMKRNVDGGFRWRVPPTTPKTKT